MGEGTIMENYEFFKCFYCDSYHKKDVETCPMTGEYIFPAHTYAFRTIEDEFLVRDPIGEGPMSVLYECEHLPTETRLAAKLLKMNLLAFREARDSYERFKRETKATELMAHENIVEVKKVGSTEEGVPYIIMELLDGNDVGKIVSAWGKIPMKDACGIICKVLRALDAAHSHGIVHGNIKPENIFLMHQSYGSGAVKVLDFGISKLAGRIQKYIETSQPGYQPETPYYISPEQARGDTSFDHRSDIFSLGVVFYEMVTGFKPFHAESYGRQLLDIIGAPAPDPSEHIPGLPDAIAEFMSVSMAKDPGERFQSAGEMLRELRALDLNAVSLLPPGTCKKKPEKITGRLKTPPIKEIEGKHRDFSTTGRKSVPSWIKRAAPKRKDTPPEGQKPPHHHEVAYTPEPFISC
jgi:serine/threonine protein kinase